MAKIGFIGLGIMGRHMVRNLSNGGHELVAYDIVPALVDPVVNDRIERGLSSADVARRTDVVITMLPDGPEVEQAALGPGGVLEGARPGTIFVEYEFHQPRCFEENWRRVSGRTCAFSMRPSVAASPRRSTAHLPSWSAEI